MIFIIYHKLRCLYSVLSAVCPLCRAKEGGLFACLYNVKQYAEHMQNTSEQNKQMENRMHIPFMFEEVIESRSYRVADSSCKQQSNSAPCQHLCSRLPCKNYAPAHYEIADCRKSSECFQINSVQRNSYGGNTPDDSEHCPAESRVILPHGTQCKRRISAGDQQKYRAMVYHLKNSFCHKLRTQSMINA